MHLHSHFGIYFPCFNCHSKLNTKCNCKGHVCATLLEGDGRFGPTIILASVRVRGCNAFIAIGVMGQNNSLIIIFFFWFFFIYFTKLRQSLAYVQISALTMCRFPARTDTDDLATTDDPPPAPMRWLNLHCGVKWTFSGDDFWRRKELPSLFSCTITCKMLWIACVPSVLFQYGRKQRSLQQLMTLPPPRCGGRIYIVVFAGAFFLRRKNGINLLPLVFLFSSHKKSRCPRINLVRCHAARQSTGLLRARMCAILTAARLGGFTVRARNIFCNAKDASRQ